MSILWDCLSLGLEWKLTFFQSWGHCWVSQICQHIECSTLTASLTVHLKMVTVLNITTNKKRNLRTLQKLVNVNPISLFFFFKIGLAILVSLPFSVLLATYWHLWRAFAVSLCRDWILCCCSCWSSTHPEGSSGWRTLCAPGELVGQVFSQIFSGTGSWS